MALISYLTRIEFEPGGVARLAVFLDQLQIRRPLLVSDPGLVATGLVARVQALAGRESVLFGETPANPTEAAARAAHALYAAEACDGIVGLGGGSSIDLAKAVRLLTGHAPPLAQYAAVEGGVARIHGGICPLIAIPTTAGTGSEVGRAAVIITEEGRKLGIISPFMLPSLALCDPELTYGLPPGLTAATGMDALSHCLETYMAPAINPPADAIALDGLKRGLAAIRRAVENGRDETARWEMMMCALEGAMAFQKGLGAVHSLTHPLGAVRELNLHHGTLNAILMPAVLRFNRAAIGGKWRVLQELLGAEPDQAIAALCREIAIPSGLAALGVTEPVMRAVAAEALRDHCHATNPRIATEGEYLALLRESA